MSSQSVFNQLITTDAYVLGLIHREDCAMDQRGQIIRQIWFWDAIAYRDCDWMTVRSDITIDPRSWLSALRGAIRPKMTMWVKLRSTTGPMRQPVVLDDQRVPDRVG
jgi:hypothetical protein